MVAAAGAAPLTSDAQCALSSIIWMTDCDNEFNESQPERLSWTSTERWKVCSVRAQPLLGHQHGIGGCWLTAMSSWLPWVVVVRSDAQLGGGGGGGGGIGTWQLVGKVFTFVAIVTVAVGAGWAIATRVGGNDDDDDDGGDQGCDTSRVVPQSGVGVVGSAAGDAVIIRSPRDKRGYRTFYLENGLRCLVCMRRYPASQACLGGAISWAQGVLSSCGLDQTLFWKPMRLSRDVH